MSDLEEFAAEVYKCQFDYSDWSDWAIRNRSYSLEDIQTMLEDLDSMWSVEEFDEIELRRTIRDVVSLANNIKDHHLYHTRQGDYIQLSDNHTEFEVDIENEQESAIYYDYVNDAAQVFEDRSGTPIRFLGNSGRHICVDNTYENAVRFDELYDLQQELEKAVIEDYNTSKALGFEEFGDF